MSVQSDKALHFTCARCGYDLTGMPGRDCPECGTPVIQSVVENDRRRGLVPRRQREWGMWWVQPVLLAILPGVVAVYESSLFLRAAHGERLATYSRISGSHVEGPTAGMIHHGLFALLTGGMAVGVVGLSVVERVMRKRAEWARNSPPRPK